MTAFPILASRAGLVAGAAAAMVTALPRLLVAYASSEGQTERIACRLAERLRQAAFEVDLHRIGVGLPDVDPLRYDGLVVGGSIRYGRHAKALRAWLRWHGPRLDGAYPLGVFTVYLNVLAARDDLRDKALWYNRALEDLAGRPANDTTVFAGALRYRSYPPLLRWAMKRRARGLSGNVEDVPTDTARDHVYTDWAQVDAFADTFAALVQAAA